MDIIEILKLGLPGLVFLLSLLSYRLLSMEQKKHEPSQAILQSIRQYMNVNIFLAVLTVAAPVADSLYTPSSKVFNVEAKLSGTPLASGSAAVCNDAAYGGRYILINDRKTTKMIQVYAMKILPCNGNELIALNSTDASKLGWDGGNVSTAVEISAAQQGQKYILRES